METLEIISTQLTVQARQIINGNTANFSWNTEEGQIPPVINFNVQRGVAGDEEFNGNNVISGAYYTEQNKIDTFNYDADLDIQSEIVSVCKSICVVE